MWKDIIELVDVENSQNDTGDNLEVFSFKKVYANKLPVRQSEFYQAMSTGIRPEVMFEIRSIEFEGQTKIRFENKFFRIIRLFEKGENIELICQGMVVS